MVDTASTTTGRWVHDLRELDRSRIALVGGKAAHLGELSRIEGVEVPAGYCVSTDAFRLFTAQVPAFDELVDRLDGLAADDPAGLAGLAAQIRAAMESAPVPDDLAAEIAAAAGGGGRAVRSSATAEDLPTASSAGQQDTYLNVVGSSAVVGHVRSCWASLFTERAVAYRARHGIDHRTARMAVIVQEMVDPQGSGVLFTADPVSSNRTVVAVEACFGLGEALVSGRVDADHHTVRDGIVGTTIGSKALAVRPSPGGGTWTDAVDPRMQRRPVLTDAQVLELARLGRRIEAALGAPQDIEWCLADGRFRILQSRPITTLFPVPVTTDGRPHVYVSVGHQQMMTDAMTPLGLSVWQRTTPRQMAEAGGRLFVDVVDQLASPVTRELVLGGLGASDPLIRDALQTVLDGGGIVPDVPPPAPPQPPAGAAEPAPIDADPALVEELVAHWRASLAAVERDIAELRGPELFDFLETDLGELQRLLIEPRSHQVIMAGMQATWWLNDRMREWLGEANAADTLARSAPGNVTSEMGLALLDVADAIRPHPAVVDHLRTAVDRGFPDGFPGELAGLPGGHDARDAILGYLDRYGARCVGEIDIARPRWAERPGDLVAVLLGNVDNAGPGAGRRRFEQGRQEAAAKEQDLLERLRALPDGARKADETAAMIDRLRTFVGYREYPKFAMIGRYFAYKRALLREADRLVRDGVLGDREDCFLLRLDELHDVARTGRVDDTLVHRRRAELDRFRALTPPRVLTSDGETVAGTYRRDDVPDGALIGLPASTGEVEGRARVVPDLAAADLRTGDILVTAFTDPSWSPAFVTVAGLVTEVGGLMTHGAVIAREYGLPAVVGVAGATRLIRDGQWIRVDGTSGHVRILAE
ncbi:MULTISPECIES: rifamycin-inactivating phosphotransferase [Pseudonocardia]|uniref:Phosphoenolpyruvate synthase n=2 Tax=Pseudonocardia TaxID=1847 RepID=A0A1Y2MT09_PSEAH|nr:MULTISPECIES: rifamycin-inactivating phosphotransferase [Pseudonocardia]OSY38346.1 Phosphoenolpyruvate synthase [Pseudonocardia autotrophica]TDN72609.1 pyruvate,water dikinase [Pseudonocardia autotrophica]BBG03318.1 putative phosphoenolpyruvate synthase [Pseudonocardia autotrophica]GEC24576.1 putative phosphoenolpyruvate synthase [Pseudonocardia saturnea]